MPPWDQLNFVTQGGGLGHNYLVLYQDRPIGIYKPRENASSIRNEVSAWAADDQMLGLDVVPYTREWTGPNGKGTLQEFVPNDGPCFEYRTPQGQALAVFDYIMGSGDRHYFNALRRADVPGGIAGIDNESILGRPTVNQSSIIRSNAIVENFDQPLDSGLIERLKMVDPDRFSEYLQSLNHPAPTADWAARRLAEVQQHGKITGEAWGAAIVNETFHVIYPPGYDNVADYLNDHRPTDEEMK